MYSIYNTMSNYNFLEGQTPQLIEIDSTFTISHNANTVTFNANESHSLQSFVEKIKNDLGLTNQIDFTEDSYISYRRMQDLFPLTPIGSIMMWSGTINDKSPTDINGLTYTKWKVCDGTNGTPDLRNRFIVGSGSNYSIGNTGGADNVTLTTAQMPSHNHTLTIDANGNHNHEIKTHNDDFNHSGGTHEKIGWENHDSHDYKTWKSTENSGSHSHTSSMGNTGSGQSHENRPPYYALAFIMRIA